MKIKKKCVKRRKIRIIELQESRRIIKFPLNEVRNDVETTFYLDTYPRMEGMNLERALIKSRKTTIFPVDPKIRKSIKVFILLIVRMN